VKTEDVKMEFIIEKLPPVGG